MNEPCTFAWIFVMALGACGDPTATCPEDFPVERDGFCYRADAGVGGPLDADTPDTALDGRVQDGGEADVTSGRDGGADGSNPADAGSCEGTHPLVDGDRRYCGAADCYCPSTDACFTSARAETCCDEAPVCAPPDAGTSDAGCSGTHPLVEGERRYCAPGDCYCATPDSCHSAATAVACCEVDVVCD